MTPTTYVHQCPECQNWQVDYDINVMMDQFMAMGVVEGQIAADPRPMHDAIEYVVHEHYREAHVLAYQRFLKTGSL